MDVDTPYPRATGRTRALRNLILIALALLASLSVLLINGKPLFYYDSPAYIQQGSNILQKLGLLADTTALEGATGSEAGEPTDDTVNGSRSAVYSLIVALVLQVSKIATIPFANIALITVAVWLPMRIVGRLFAPGLSSVTLVTLPIIAAAFGSLPFYLAFVMPDILTGVLLLIIATLTVFARQMNRWEIALALALGILAVVSHISHIAIAAALIPVAALGALIGGRARWWLAPVLVLVMVLSGLTERAAFRVAVQSVASSQVVYIPFLTARLIEDGPGLTYLRDNCPKSGLASCTLFDALSKSDDPMRLTASHIIFETSAELGSFRLLTSDEQAGVAREQYRFFLKVLLDAPLLTSLAIVKNTFIQAALNSIQMTIPDEDTAMNVQQGYPDVHGVFSLGRLSQNRDWIDVIDPVHRAVYVASLAILLFSLALSRRVPGQIKMFVLICLLGILANAFVSGAASQPADRYGARVIWLLPFLALVVSIFTLGHRFSQVSDD